MTLTPEIAPGNRLTVLMTNRSAPGSFCAEIASLVYEPILGVITEKVQRPILWADEDSSTPRYLETGDSARLYLGTLQDPSPGSRRGAPSIKFAWKPFSVYFPKAGTVLRASVRIWRAESGDFELAWFEMGADGASQHVFKRAEVPFGS